MDTTGSAARSFRPMADEDGPDESPEPAPAPAPETAPPRRAGLLVDWERTVAVAIGIVTLAAALLTYVAVLQDDASSDARGQATLETLQVQRQELVGAVRVQGEEAAADHYRGQLAQAEALEAQARAAQSDGRPDQAAQLRAEALELRYVANTLKETTFDASQLSDATSSATYDADHRRDTIQGYDAFNEIQPDQPAHTAQVAEDRHHQSVRTLWSVLLLLLLAVALTVGRLLGPRWRVVVLAVTVTGFVAACAGAALNATVG
jgi:hypothetical protein